jgi:hypothetical protein
MGKKEITLEELEALIIDFKNTFSDVGTKIPLIHNNDGNMEAAFSEAKAELNAILNPAKTVKE